MYFKIANMFFFCTLVRSGLIVNDRQQDPPSLTVARPEQIAKLLVVD
jgi:hypothetical protein